MAFVHERQSLVAMQAPCSALPAASLVVTVPLAQGRQRVRTSDSWRYRELLFHAIWRQPIDLSDHKTRPAYPLTITKTLIRSDQLMLCHHCHLITRGISWLFNWLYCMIMSREYNMIHHHGIWPAPTIVWMMSVRKVVVKRMKIRYRKCPISEEHRLDHYQKLNHRALVIPNHQYQAIQNCHCRRKEHRTGACHR